MGKRHSRQFVFNRMRVQDTKTLSRENEAET